MNTLYYGDCLEIMEAMPIKGVDLIYLDPPFNSNKQYNSIYKDETGRPLPEQIEAFCDQWTLDKERERAIRDMPIFMKKKGVEDEKIAEFWRVWVTALRATQPSLLAYLSYMVQRLLVMRTLLSDTGSIYLHCDSTASHYLKIMMDGIFGHKNFRREIVWSNEDSSGFKSQAENWIRGHDTILYYSRGSNPVFNKLYSPLDEKTIRRYDKTDEEGKRYKIYRNKKDGSERRSYLQEDRGVGLRSVWTDIPGFQKVNNTGEYLGYETQKPLALLDRIIKASSNEGDTVLDPFCGCATTIHAAHLLKRKWIGIDIAIHAIKRVAKKRLEERLRLVEERDFEIKGIPQNMEGAKDLWRRDPYHFQKWCVETVDGFVTAKKTADRGIDGRLYFNTGGKELQSMVLEVKGGDNVEIKDVRALRSVMEREDAEMAGLVVMKELGKIQRRNFDKEMAAAGDFEASGRPFPRMQILTVSEMLEGKRFETPFPQGKRERQTSFSF